MFSSINFPAGTKAEALANGVAFIAQNRLTDAIALYSQWLLYLRKDVDFLKARAMAYYKNKQPDAGKRDLDQVSLILKEASLQQTIQVCRTRLEVLNQKILENPQERFNENVRKAICKNFYTLGLAYAQLGDAASACQHLLVAAGTEDLMFEYSEEVDSENIVQESERDAAFKYLQEFAEHKEAAVKDVSNKIAHFKTYKENFKELIALLKKRALIYYDLKFYKKALQDLMFASWVNHLNVKNNSSIVINYFELAELMSNCLLHLLNGFALFNFQREVMLHDQQLRDSNCPLKHLKLSRSQREKRFWNSVLKKCYDILASKKHIPNLENDTTTIEFLAYVLIRFNDIDTSLVKKEELTIFTSHKIQDWLSVVVKSYRARNLLLDVVKLYNQALGVWPDNVVLQKGLKAAELVADPSFMVDEPAAKKEIVPVVKSIKVKQQTELKRELTPKLALEDDSKGSGTLYIQELIKEKAKKEEEMRQARNEKVKKRNRKKKPASSRREAQVVVEEEKEQKAHEEELEQQQREELELQQQRERELKIAEEESKRQKTVENFKASIEQRLALYEKQKKEFETRLAEKKAGEVVARVAVSSEAWVLLDTLENAGVDVKAELFGGYVRTLAFQLFGLAQNDLINDLDVKTTLASERIADALKVFGVQPVLIKNAQGETIAKENFFEIKLSKLHEHDYSNIQIIHKPHHGYLAEVKELDFTINSLTANKFGELRDPTGLGLLHIKNRILATVNPSSAASFAEDPSRTLRGGFYKYKYQLAADDELMANMEKFADEIPLMKEVFRIHSWMKSHFSREFVAPNTAVENFKFLQYGFENPKTKIAWNFLSKLFAKNAVQKILQSEKWICTQLYKGVDTIADIYMIFFVAIAMNTSGYRLDPANVKREIFADNPLLRDALGRPGFRFTYVKYLQEWPRQYAGAQFRLYQAGNNALPNLLCAGGVMRMKM